MTSPRFPLEPLAQALGIPLITREQAGPNDVGVGYQPIADACDVSWRTVARWAADGLSTYAADRAAITALGLHPMLIWPNWLEPPTDQRHKVAA